MKHSLINSLAKNLIHVGLLYLFLAGVSSGVTAETTVYKKVLPDGTVVYSDQPDDSAQKLTVEPITTVPAVKPINTQRSVKKKKEKIQYYKTMNIIKPSEGAAMFSGDGNVEINVNSVPPLKQGDKYVFLLNGNIAATQSEPVAILENVARGSYDLTVNIINARGEFEIGASSTFSIQRPRVRASN